MEENGHHVLESAEHNSEEDNEVLCILIRDFSINEPVVLSVRAEELGIPL